MKPASPPDRRSARAILVNDGQVALIERKRAGNHFFVFPGGSVEPGESSSQAVARECEEELGLAIRPTRIVAEVTFPDRIQAFWLAEIVAGVFGSGTGPEVTGQEDERNGTYHPIWMPVRDVLRYDVLPRRLASELLHWHESGWPAEILRFTDDFMWWIRDERLPSRGRSRAGRSPRRWSDS